MYERDLALCLWFRVCYALVRWIASVEMMLSVSLLHRFLTRRFRRGCAAGTTSGRAVPT